MGESMSSEPKVITSFEEAPQSLRDKCDKEVLRAFFNAHFSITEKSVNDDKRFYLDDGRRIKDDDILVAYMKDRKVWTEPGVEIRTITGELTNKFGEKKLKDFFAAGFFLTKKRIKKNKWRYYLPDGRCLDSEKKLDDFLLEKLRPAFDKELCDRVIDTAATAIPGVDKSELFISDTENEKAACLNVKLDGKVYKEAILPYVSYEGIISSSLYNNLYSRCTVLHKRNIERFEKSHDLKALKQIAESILLSLQVDEKHILLGDFCITSNKITDINVGLQQESALKKAVVTTTVKFDNGRKAVFSIQVAFGINDVLLQELYRKEECDTFEAVFCRRFLQYSYAPKPKESSIPKKRATNSVATFVDMPDDALEECRKKTQANRDQAQADIENYRRSNRGKESVSNQQKVVDALREEAEQKRQAVLQAYDDYQKAVASVTLAENRQLVDKIEQLLQKVNTETNRELAAYGIMERQLRNSLASGTSQELAVSQKLLLSAAVIARSAKEISLYMDFISLAKAFQDLAKSVKTSQSKVSEDTTVKVAIKERGKATGEWEKAKEALHKAEAELEKQEMQKALYESNLRTREKRVTSYDAILTNIRKAQQEKQMQSIEKEQSLRHREVFSGGHNAVRSKKQTDALLNEDVSKLSNADIEKVLTFIRTNAKNFRQKLRKLYITQQKKQIDVKKTIEKSVQCDGEIARLYYKKPIKSKANVVMLADISGSCRAMTSLALTYMGLMREVFPGGCHLFVFVNHLVPVDRYFSNENVTSAVESINKSVPSRGIYSNYGVPLKELRYDNTGIINKDTTIVMLGDCRNNKNYSGVEEVEWLSKRASNFFVLNPDPLNKWGQGDSIADLYAKSGATVCRVSSTQDLLTFLESASLRKHA